MLMGFHGMVLGLDGCSPAGYSGSLTERGVIEPPRGLMRTEEPVFGIALGKPFTLGRPSTASIRLFFNGKKCYLLVIMRPLLCCLTKGGPLSRRSRAVFPPI